MCSSGKLIPTTPPVNSRGNYAHDCIENRYTAGIVLEVGAEGFEPPPAGLEPAILPSYTIPPMSNSLRRSRLGLTACTLSTAQLLLTPLPPLITGFLPST